MFLAQYPKSYRLSFRCGPFEAKQFWRNQNRLKGTSPVVFSFFMGVPSGPILILNRTSCDPTFTGNIFVCGPLHHRDTVLVFKIFLSDWMWICAE